MHADKLALARRVQPNNRSVVARKDIRKRRLVPQAVTVRHDPEHAAHRLGGHRVAVQIAHRSVPRSGHGVQEHFSNSVSSTFYKCPGHRRRFRTCGSDIIHGRGSMVRGGGGDHNDLIADVPLLSPHEICGGGHSFSRIFTRSINVFQRLNGPSSTPSSASNTLSLYRLLVNLWRG